MKTLKKTAYLALIALLSITIGCSKDDKNDPEESGNSGAPHTYDITVDGQRYNGEIDNVSLGVNGENGAETALSTFVKNGDERIVTSSLTNNDIYIFGEFYYPNGQGGNITIDEDSESIIEFMPAMGKSYSSISGTAKVVVGEKITIGPGLPQFSALNIEFSGTFRYLDENNDEQTSQASGTYTINLPPSY